MNREFREELRIRYKMMTLEFAEGLGNVIKGCRKLEVPRSTFCEWKKKFNIEGRKCLVRKKPIAYSQSKKFSSDVLKKSVDLRQTYHFESRRIAWYLEGCHGVTTSCSTVYRALIKKLTDWENFYNLHQRHSAFDGKIPYKALNLLLKKSSELYRRAHCS